MLGSRPARWLRGLAGLTLAAAVAGCDGSGPGSAAPLPTGRPTFEDVTDRAGIRFTSPSLPRPITIRTSFGTGCGFVDYDADGWPDLLLIGKPRVALYHNERDGTFRDVTASLGLGMKGEWHGVAAGDYDGDGWADLYLTGFHQGLLLRNERGRRFRDDSARLRGLKHGWESSAGFADLDQDGDLDLYIGQYVQFGPGSRLYCELASGVRSGCPPQKYPVEKGKLLRNDGDRFTDVTAASGMGAGEGRNLALGFADYDRDGRLDLYVANDGLPASLFRNLGGMRFRNVGFKTGTALSADGRPQAAMGVAWADYNRDGWLDLAVTTFSGEDYALYRNGGAFFDPVASETGLAGPTRQMLGFGVQWLDADNDGWPDLLFANGHVYDNTEAIASGTTFRQPLQLFRNHLGSRFEDQGVRAGDVFQRPVVARGMAVADYDRDGRMDVLVSTLEGQPMLLRNTTANRSDWLRFRLTGKALTGDGALITLSTSGGSMQAAATSSGSYLSASDPVAHFGLPPGTRVTGAEVRWPDGKRQKIRLPGEGNGEITLQRLHSGEKIKAMR